MTLVPRQRCCPADSTISRTDGAGDVIRAAWFSIVTVAATAYYSTLAIVAGLRGAPHEFYDGVHRGWARVLLRAAGVTVRAEGLENIEAGEAAILVSNHQSNFDIFSLFLALPVSIRFVAKSELARIPVLAQAMRAAGHVFIDRTDRRGSAGAMRLAGDRLRVERLCLGLFPEGTRSRNGELGRFKKGSFALAIETQLPIVPIAVDGGWQLAGRGRIRPGEVRIRVGNHIPTEGKTAEDRDAVLAEVRAAVEGLLTSLRVGSEDSIPT
jgi:1-acyl-sn-glycerol-3-phosphate acyltransferase